VFTSEETQRAMRPPVQRSRTLIGDVLVGGVAGRSVLVVPDRPQHDHRTHGALERMPDAARISAEIDRVAR
jgi:hypothetical protein